MAGVGASYVINTFYAVWLVSTALSYSPGAGSLAMVLVMLPSVLLVSPAGWLSDVLGRKPVLLGVSVCNLLVLLAPIGASSVSLPWLFASLVLISVSTGVWTAVGAAQVIDSLDEHDELSMQKHGISLGYVIDSGKLAAVGLLALAAMRAMILVDVIVVFLLLLMAFGATAHIVSGSKSEAAGEAVGSVAIWPLILIFSVAIALHGGSGTQQAGMVSIAGVVSHWGTVWSNFAWTFGALVGSTVLWISLPMRDRRLILAFGVCGVGFLLLAMGGSWAILGIFINGVSAAMFWQALRITVIRKLPAKYRGRFSGVVVSSNNATMIIGVVAILHFGVLVGYGIVFLGSTTVTLIAIVPLMIGLRRLEKVVAPPPVSVMLVNKRDVKSWAS